MKKTIRTRFFVGLLSLTVLLTTVPSQVFAVAGSVYFYPTGDVQNNSQFTVEIRGNVPTPGWGRGGGATIRVAYDATKLEVVDRSDVGGVFRPNNGQNWNGTTAGLVRYESRIFFNAPGVNDRKIFSITFKAISPGNTTLSFASANVNDGPTTGTASTFTIHPLTCPSGQIGTPPNCKTPPKPTPKPTTTPRPSTTPRPTSRPAPTPTTPTPTPTPPPETVEETPEPESNSQGGLAIENVRVTASRQSNSISWTINDPSDVKPVFTFGTSRGEQKTESAVTKGEDGTYTTELPSLKAGTLYHFTIKVASTDQLSGATHSGTITTRGYPVQLTIKQNGVLASGAKVKIGDRSFTANKNAIITAELSDGNHDATITPAGSTEALRVSFTVQKKPVPATGNPELQAFVLNGTVNGAAGENDSTAFLATVGGILAAILGLGGLIGFLLYRRKQQEATTEYSSVDTDALAAYGPSLQESRDMTPEPNLQAVSTVTSAFTDNPAVTTAGATMYETDAIYDAEQPYTAASYQQDTPEASAPAETLPLPPEYDQYTQQQPLEYGQQLPVPILPADTTAFDQPQPVASEQLPFDGDTPYTPGGEAAEELHEVEDEPSAVFDAATGELEILHKHNTPIHVSPTSVTPGGLPQ